MRYVLIILFTFSLCFSAYAAEDGKCPKGTSVVPGSGSNVGATICCPDSAASKERPHGPGGGNSGNGNSGVSMAENNKKVLEVAKQQAEAMKKNSQAASEGMFDFLLSKCIAGINSNILKTVGGLLTGNFMKAFTDGLTGLAEAAISKGKEAVCNLIHQESQKAIDKLISKATITLPGGIGTIGANTNIFGYGLINTTTAGSVKDSTLMSDKAIPQINGMIILQNGVGSMLGKINGLGDVDSKILDNLIKY